MEPLADPLDHVRLAMQLGKDLHQAWRIGFTLLGVRAHQASMLVISLADLADAVVESQMISS